MGFFLHEAELKIKRVKKDKKPDQFTGNAKVSRLEDMFLDMNTNALNFFCLLTTVKAMRTLLIIIRREERNTFLSMHDYLEANFIIM